MVMPGALTDTDPSQGHLLLKTEKRGYGAIVSKENVLIEALSTGHRYVQFVDKPHAEYSNLSLT
jgi:hypothetical protein